MIPPQIKDWKDWDSTKCLSPSEEFLSVQAPKVRILYQKTNQHEKSEAFFRTPHLCLLAVS